MGGGGGGGVGRGGGGGAGGALTGERVPELVSRGFGYEAVLLGLFCLLGVVPALALSGSLVFGVFGGPGGGTAASHWAVPMTMVCCALVWRAAVFPVVRRNLAHVETRSRGGLAVYV